MARRFGGRYSPGTEAGEAPAPALRRDPVGLRANLLWVPPALLTVLAPLNWGLVGAASDLFVAALLFLAAWLTREGMRAQFAYEGRTSARRPAFPRKIIASGLTGIAVALAGQFSRETPGLVEPVGISIFLGLFAGLLHLVAFGPDPLKDKRPAGVDAYQSERVQRMIDEAEETLAQMHARIEPLRIRALTERVETFAAAVRALAAQVAADPRDLAGARRYLGVYLRGARDATARFADLHARAPDPEARARWEALVDEMRAGVTQRIEKLRLDDRSGLDIEIDVLRDRLRREGVAITREETTS